MWLGIPLSVIFRRAAYDLGSINCCVSLPENFGSSWFKQRIRIAAPSHQFVALLLVAVGYWDAGRALGCPPMASCLCKI
jgi:hypothetical protein